MTTLPTLNDDRPVSTLTLSSTVLEEYLALKINNHYTLNDVNAAFPGLLIYLNDNRTVSEFHQSVFEFARTKRQMSGKQIKALLKDRDQHNDTVSNLDGPVSRGATPVLLPRTLPAHHITTMFTAAMIGGTLKPRFKAGDYSIFPFSSGDNLCVSHKQDGMVGHINTKTHQFILGITNPAGITNSVQHMAGLSLLFSDPLAYAKQHGKETGECSCCGRTLTDPISIRHGIGPVCGKRWFNIKRSS